ncbi:TonB-dependent receptor plug domain-containing protein [Thalassotalea mangrovi]|uniref:TonB-dependent receptor n=1 Tax=Thalassotalea mangrovi TaxID=2572245 RepID=A0A4U1BA01_9GAMM|nr:TonB-dependent receptor [Thalassotalea mangrovi]TKB46940.1 TonB-dependent receptor [Thalassotalea mangrovi]
MLRAVNTLLFSAISMASLASTNGDTRLDDIENITVEGKATANTIPVGTFAAPISNLEYDPRVDLQSRNMAEAQADISIRGGIFENTGFRVGSNTLYDPQTGHYFAEIPIAPEMLTPASVLTGVNNSLYGVNSSVGTVSYQWKPIQTGGGLSVGAGNNGFNIQRIYSAYRWPDDSKNGSWGAEVEYSRSQSDGTIENGDHQFERASARIQRIDSDSQTDLFFGYQEKFFGWPNMYTPWNVNETEDLRTRLLMLNHVQEYATNSSFEVSAYYRKHNDHYVYSRENPEIFQAFHETDVKSLAWSGNHHINSDIAINYAGQFMADEIESTSLENNFTSRDYYKFSIVPEYQKQLTNSQSLTFRLGGAFDDTNRDDSRFSVISDVSLFTVNADNSTRTFYFSYAEATQVAGYSAIGGSETGGLFRSNYDLQRESSQNLELGLSLDKLDWRLDSAIFYRWDNELTDWTYSFDSTSARTANQVDIETLGLEFIAIKSLDSVTLVASYTFLDKSENYLGENIDASFYALNYPPHRVTLGATWSPSETVEIRIDNEWRKQEDNALRKGDDSALFTHLTLTYAPAQFDALDIVLAVDNLWDESFEEIPGTPGRGDQFSATVNYHW